MAYQDERAKAMGNPDMRRSIATTVEGFDRLLANKGTRHGAGLELERPALGCRGSRCTSLCWLFEQVATDNTPFHRISHQCARLLGKLAGNSKSPTVIKQ
jgi:hypothetical protein